MGGEFIGWMWRRGEEESWECQQNVSLIEKLDRNYRTNQKLRSKGETLEYAGRRNSDSRG